MSPQLFQQLRAIQDEFVAAKAATGYLRDAWPRLAGTPETQGVSYNSLRTADDNLERTYIIRLFAKFEDMLREYLLLQYHGIKIPWKTEDLINRVASRRHIPIASGTMFIVCGRTATPSYTAPVRPSLSSVSCKR